MQEVMHQENATPIGLERQRRKNDQGGDEYVCTLRVLEDWL